MNRTPQPANPAPDSAGLRPASSARSTPLLRDRNIAWLMAGSAVSLLGDQFTLLALPWLVLHMTGDPLVLGTVLALLGLPRALFILLGGALVDSHSPQRVLMRSKQVCTVLLALLAALVLLDGLTLPRVYALAFAIGLATAFSIPAASAMLPQVVAPARLQAANGLLMGLRQLSFFVGPLLAGGLIALCGSGPAADALNAVGAASAANVAGTVRDARGIGLAFALDALSYALSAWTLSRVRTRPQPARSAVPVQPVLAAVAGGLRSFWRDTALRNCLLYFAAVALLISGPVQVALPLLVSRLPGLGAVGFGGLMAVHGGAMLLGMALSGALPRLRVVNLGITLLAVDGLVGLLFMPMGQIRTLWQGAVLAALIGVLGGYIQVAVFTWIQRRVAPALLGRAMGVFMFIFMGLAPLSAAVTGWLLRSVPLATVFLAAGGALVGLVAVTLASGAMRRVVDAAPVDD